MTTITATLPNHLSSEADHIVQTAHRLADAARSVILPYFRNASIVTDNKDASGFDPVTIADRAAEEVMRDILAKDRPNDAILGEEFGEQSGTSGITWVLDPIDGTRGFISGTPTWGVLISASTEKGPIFGLIDQPYIGERFVGGLGHSYVDGPMGQRPLASSNTQRLDQAILMTTFPEVGTEQERAAFEAVASQTKLVRFGMDCYAYALVASGQVDLVIEAGLNPYDIHGPIAVIEAAGGVVTNWSGGPAHQGGQLIAAANRDILNAALPHLTHFAE